MDARCSARKSSSAFTSTATRYGGQETTLLSILTNLMHFGMVIVGLPYSFQGQMTLDEISDAAHTAATSIAGVDGRRMPSAIGRARRHRWFISEPTPREGKEPPQRARILNQSSEARKPSSSSSRTRPL